METRKIQMTGGSSYIVTLPKEWIVSNSLKKNDTVNITVNEDRTLTLSSAEVPTVRSRNSKIISVDDTDDPESLFRILLGAYMAGFGELDIRSSGMISGKSMDVIERFVQTAIGLEIIEATDQSVTVKDLVDPSEMKLTKSLERMKSLVKNMLSDIFEALRNDDTETLDDIIGRDVDVDRLEWLTTRQTKMIQNDAAVAKKMEMSASEAMTFYTLCRIMERIGDHAIILTKNCNKIMKSKSLSEKMRSELSEMGNDTVRIFTESMDLFSGKDPGDANRCIRETKKIVEQSKRMNKFAEGTADELLISLTLIAGSMRRVSEYTTDIAELAINSMMSR